jgi:hypothetical protein
VPGRPALYVAPPSRSHARVEASAACRYADTRKTHIEMRARQHADASLKS